MVVWGHFAGLGHICNFSFVSKYPYESFISLER